MKFSEFVVATFIAGGTGVGVLCLREKREYAAIVALSLLATLVLVYFTGWWIRRKRRAS